MTPGRKTRPPSEDLNDNYRRIRDRTERLCETLEIEDYVIQSMPDVSPTKWHLAHTTWFFEVFLLGELEKGYKPYRPIYHYLFNSYYNTYGRQWTRRDRGILSRPTVDAVYTYRRDVDGRVTSLLEESDGETRIRASELLDVALNHEQQHQELMLTDLKHVLSISPESPVYREVPHSPAAGDAGSLRWHRFDGGTRAIGFDGPDFAYDNESPRHDVHLEPFALASRPVTCGEYLEFIEDGGYGRPDLWLSDGWDLLQQTRWDAPLYWRKRDGKWRLFTLAGERDIDRSEPVTHVSFYEADAYARWSGDRLPTEEEWEIASEEVSMKGNFVENGLYHPAGLLPGEGDDQPARLFGDVWEWTGSPYRPYPGYRIPEGALGEYNAKFMVNQLVLRGGSCATPEDHIRRTYRNFFPPNARWQFMGIRLARDGA